jgi:hypothetical protein
VRALAPVPCLPPGSMSRILDGKPVEMCELSHGSREIEAQIGGYLPGLKEDAA